MMMDEIDAARLFRQARGFVDEGLPLHAVQIYRRLVASFPSDALPPTELARLYSEMGQAHAAVDLLSRTAAKLPGNPDILFELGNALAQAGRHEAAASVYERLRGERRPEVHLRLGLTYRALGNEEAAASQFRLAGKYDPSFPRAGELLGESLCRLGQYAAAVTVLERAAHSDRYSAAVHGLLGLALGALFEWEQAYDHLILALDLDPGSAERWQQCGEALLELDRAAEAEPYFRKAVSLMPTPAALVDLGVALEQKGERESALRTFREARALGAGAARRRGARWRRCGLFTGDPWK